MLVAAAHRGCSNVVCGVISLQCTATQQHDTQTALIKWSIQSVADRGQHTVRVHLHHDHRDCLVADPDDPGASLSLPSLLIGWGSLWGGGLSLTCLLGLARRLSGRGLSLSAVSRNSHCGTQIHLSVKTQAQYD